MYKDDNENRIEDRTKAVQEEKTEELQALPVSDENDENNASDSTQQNAYTDQQPAYRPYANPTSAMPGSVQPGSSPDGQHDINGSGQNGSYGNNQNSSYRNEQSSSYRNEQSSSYGNGQNSSYGSGQTSSYGNGQNSSYGNGQSSSYGNGQTSSYGNGQNSSYGNGQSSSYGNGQNGSYGNGQTSSYGNGQNGSYGNGQNSSYGSGQSGSYGNRQIGNNYGQHYAPWQQPQNGFSAGKNKAQAKRPFPPLVKKTAGIVAAALLFGVVAGTTMSGVQMLTKSLNPSADQEQVTLSQAETLPAPKTSDSENKASVIVTGTNDVSAIVEHAMPSVVAINSVTQHEVQNWFGQSQIYEGRGSGSGIIVGESESELLLVTNNHVIEGANSLSVSFCDNESAEAHIKGTDSENDLAVLAVSLDQISDDTKSRIAVATLGDSDALKVGQGVIAIGNALGYGQSVTVGYISALDREVHTDEQTTRNLLQTDAAINPGNSGGALLNMQGELVGINSAKYSSTDVEGMGYAIPISKVRSIIDELMTKKTRVQIEQERQGYLGIQGTDIDANTSNLYGMPQGVFVYKIVEGGAAASSDLKEKDIITKFDGQTIKTMAELKDMLIYYAGGDSVVLTVQSLKDGDYVERQVTITLGTRPQEENVN